MADRGFSFSTKIDRIEMTELSAEARDGIGLPTWNYVTVHAYGKAELINDQESLLSSLQLMVEIYEGPNSSYSLDRVSPEYIAGLS